MFYQLHLCSGKRINSLGLGFFQLVPEELPQWPNLQETQNPNQPKTIYIYPQNSLSKTSSLVQQDFDF